MTKKIPKNSAQKSKIKGAGYGLNEPNSAQLSWVPFVVGGEGKSTNDGLPEIPPVAEIRKLKSGLWSPRGAISSASKIAPKGSSSSSESTLDQKLMISRLKLSPVKPSLSPKVINNVDEGSKSDYSLENSDLFRVKLELRTSSTIDDQRHLFVNNVDHTAPSELRDNPVLQPSQNPNYNPAVASAPEESNLEGDMGTVGTSYRGGGRQKN